MEESYGDRFPDTNMMTWFGTKMTSCFDKSKAAYIIIVGVMGDDEKTCHLQFPLSKEIQNAYGDEEDFYEKYLTALDATGASVWLQVEPGNADLVKHWDKKWLPSAMDGLIYVNDSQGFYPSREWCRSSQTGPKPTHRSRSCSRSDTRTTETISGVQ